MAATLCVLLGVMVSDALAQRQVGAFGAGAQAGLPGGASLKLYRSNFVAYGILINTDLDDCALIYTHRLWERPIPDSPLWIYLGPGLVAGGERLQEDPEVVLGVSTLAGLNFYTDRFEVFLEVMPRLRITPTVTPRLGGSVGLRYYV